MYTGLHQEYLLLLWDFNETSLFLTNIRKILKYQISWKSVGTEVFHAGERTGGQTDMTNEGNSCFSQFCAVC